MNEEQWLLGLNHLLHKQDEDIIGHPNKGQQTDLVIRQF
jgi:hypothetical protein